MNTNMETPMETKDSTFYSIDWTTHGQHLSDSLASIHQQQFLTDFTLQVRDEKIQCHRIILWQGSGYFRDLLSGPNFQADNSTVALDSYTPATIRLLLDFMYRGKIKVTQEDFETLSVAADELRVYGLCQKKSAEEEEKDKLFDKDGTSSDDTGIHDLSPHTAAAASNLANSPYNLDEQSLSFGATLVKNAQFVKSSSRNRRFSPNLSKSPSSRSSPTSLSRRIKRSKTQKEQKYKLYTSETMRAAIDAVLIEGLTPSKASKIHGVPSRTLHDKVSKIRGPFTSTIRNEEMAVDSLINNSIEGGSCCDRSASTVYFSSNEEDGSSYTFTSCATDNTIGSQSRSNSS